MNWTCGDCGGSGYATTHDGNDLGICRTCNGDGGPSAFDAVDRYVAELEDASGIVDILESHYTAPPGRGHE